jgi:hypothetical protein
MKSIVPTHLPLLTTLPPPGSKWRKIKRLEEMSGEQRLGMGV